MFEIRCCVQNRGFRYHGFGVATGDLFDSKTTGDKWWPAGGPSINLPGDREAPKAADYGRVGTGLCHRHTRSGSLAVSNRNWHPGPGGHELNQDMVTYVVTLDPSTSLSSLADSIPVQCSLLGSRICR